MLDVTPESVLVLRNTGPIGGPGSRLERLGPAERKYRRGYGGLYLEHVLQANEGCDFGFARPAGRAGGDRAARAAQRLGRRLVSHPA